MSKDAISSPDLPPPVGPFSPAMRSGGFVFFSGQVGQDPATGKLAEGGVEAQTRQIFRNLDALLKASGKSFSDVVRAGVFLTDMAAFASVNTIYAEHFDRPYPARTTVAVAALPLGAAVEIDVIVKD